MVRNVPVILLVSTFGCQSKCACDIAGQYFWLSVCVLVTLLVSTFGCQSKCACNIAGQYFWLSV